MAPLPAEAARPLPPSSAAGHAPTGVGAGPDGVPRCAWALSAPDYLGYHDTEWGAAVRGTSQLYERIVLEGFQSGLSWITVLRKRPAFRTAFSGFDPAAVATYDEDDVSRLLADRGIIRHRGKIEAAIGNARAVLALDEDLTELVWSFAPPPRPRPASLAQVPARTPESTALADTLRRRGLRFVGPTTAYALMQACGLVDDHLAGCSVVPRPVGSP